jgi:hypothetical protein
MGYHFLSHSTIPQYKLTIGVIGGRGTIEVSSPEPLAYDPADGTYTFYAGTKVTITAIPDAGWRVISWSGGTAYGRTNANTTVVTIGSDKNVTVTFGRIRVLDVPGDYTNIWGAIADANDGDVVLIAPGTYSYQPNEHPYDNVITIDRKAITIMGTNPQDPCSVAATVIDHKWFDHNEFKSDHSED